MIWDALYDTKLVIFLIKELIHRYNSISLFPYLCNLKLKALAFAIFGVFI